MGSGGGQGICEQVQWEEGKKKALVKKILELIIQKKRKHEYS